MLSDNLYRHRGEPVEERAGQPGRCPLRYDRDIALDHFLDHAGELRLGQFGPDAAVDAVAEAQMPPGVGAPDIEAFGVLEHALVAVGRNVPHHDLLAALDRLPAKFGIA